MANTIHDLGGMHGFGPVVREDEPYVFEHAWEGRLWGMRQALIRSGKLRMRPGENRGVIEAMGAVEYLTTPYYERFLHSTLDRIVAHGLLDGDELAAAIERYVADPDAPLPRRLDPEAAAAARASLMVGPRPKAPAGDPVFAPGDVVVARNLNWDGHNRLPRYVRGHRGRVERVNGWYLIEDDHAERLGRNPQPVYTVGFDGEELWGRGGEPSLRVYVELWEGYLKRAQAEGGA